MQRFGIYRANKALINAHNQKKSNHTKGVNHFADLTHGEFKERYLTLIQSNPNRKVVALNNVAADSKDHEAEGSVTDVKDQGQCGSCWSFSATGGLEGAYKQKTGTLKSFSEQQLVDCSGSYGNYGCNGGLMDYAFQYWMDNSAELESSYSYTAVDGSCKYSASKGVTKVSDYTDVDTNEASLK